MSLGASQVIDTADAGLNPALDATAILERPDRAYNICNKQAPLSGEKDSPKAGRTNVQK